METLVLNWIARHVNYLLVILALCSPFVIMTGCEKQNSMDMARVGQ